ncbi:hypothetical protein N2152v2_006370 [Parachlorella kessleri]
MQDYVSELDTAEASREALVEDAVVWASQHGLIVGAGLRDLSIATVHAPLALLPVSYPKETFLKAKQAAQVFNLMIDRVAQDESYLQQVLAAAAEYDDFMAQLLQVLRDTADARQAARGNERVLAINRSDYMLHEPTSSLLQVELNTVASSFGCLSTLVGRLHRYLLQRSGAAAGQLERLPPNNAMDNLVDAMAAAAQEYGVEGAVMVMVVQPGERNAYDQQWLQTRLWERHQIRTLRKTLAQIAAEGSVDSSSGRLSLSGVPVAVVYFRAGYTPADYPSEAEWEARVLVERCDAYKCPTVAYQLAGAKKIQQDLTRAGVVERYVDSAEDAELLRAFFAGQWGLEDVSHPGTQEAIEQAIAAPEDYVLKPQREGGGNNLYGDELRARLQQGGPGLAAFVLMQRIKPPVNRSIMVRNGVATTAETLSELGIYGTLVRRGQQVLHNAEAGHLVRTKAASSNEGGVAAGFAVLDSPMLY